MKTMLARYPGKCSRTGARINPGDLIVFLGKGRAYLGVEDNEPDIYDSEWSITLIEEQGGMTYE